MGLPKKLLYIRFGAVILGLALLFGQFQNCTVYETPDRRDLNARGFPIEGGCIPYIDDATAGEILGSNQVTTSFLPDGLGPKTCAINDPNRGSKGLGGFRCSIDGANADRARNPPSDITMIGSSSTTPPLIYYSYMRQDTAPTLKSYVITVGVLDGRFEGINCGAAFDGTPSVNDQNEAVRIGLELVREMVNGTN